jgi:hypothetical protein
VRDAVAGVDYVTDFGAAGFVSFVRVNETL